MKKFILVLILVFLVFISACKTQTKDLEEMKNYLTTEDSVKIAYNFQKADSSKGVILIHMLGRDKSTWNNFISKLKDYNVIAIDLRGHGSSDLNYNSFSDSDYNNMIKDVKAAKLFLKEKGINQIAIIGASIGANTALNYAVTDSDIKTVVLLSPGLEYHGVKTSDSIKKLKVPVLIVVSQEDSYAYQSSVELNNKAISKKELKVYNNKGHGTNMFSGTDLNKVILDWLASNF